MKIARNLRSKPKAADFSELLPLFFWTRSLSPLPFNYPLIMSTTQINHRHPDCPIVKAQWEEPQSSPFYFEVIAVIRLLECISITQTQIQHTTRDLWTVERRCGEADRMSTHGEQVPNFLYADWPNRALPCSHVGERSCTVERSGRSLQVLFGTDGKP